MREDLDAVSAEPITMYYVCSCSPNVTVLLLVFLPAPPINFYPTFRAPAPAQTLCHDDAYTISNSKRLERDGGRMKTHHGGPECCTDVPLSSARKRGLRGWNAHPQSSPVRVIVHDGKVMEPERFREIQSMTRGQATVPRPNPEVHPVESHVTAGADFWSGAQNIVHFANPKKPSAGTNRPKPGSERRGGAIVLDAFSVTL